MVHELKTDWKHFIMFPKMGSIVKEIRYNDRNFKVDDIVILYGMYHDDTYSGEWYRTKIQDIVTDFEGLKEGYVILYLMEI